MTDEEGLDNLADRARNLNLFFNFGGTRPPGLYIETIDGKELLELQKLYGGLVRNGKRRNEGHTVWIIRDNEAEILIKKLQFHKGFRQSGKFNFAIDALDRWQRR